MNTNLPPADHPLPAVLPAISPETMARVTRAALLQTAMVGNEDVMPWLLQRTALLHEKFPGEVGRGVPTAPRRCEDTPPYPDSADSHDQHLQALAALELLKWQTNAKDFRATVDSLNEKLAGCAAAAADWKRTP